VIGGMVFVLPLKEPSDGARQLAPTREQDRKMVQPGGSSRAPRAGNLHQVDEIRAAGSEPGLPFFFPVQSESKGLLVERRLAIQV